MSVVDCEEIVRLAGRLRLSASAVREVAKLYPSDVQRMLLVARQAEAMAAELDELSRGAKPIPMRRFDRRDL